MQLHHRLRMGGSLPILMLTALSDEIDRILGLELGADDYLTKPFSKKSLIEAVIAHTKRYEEAEYGN